LVWNVVDDESVTHNNNNYFRPTSTKPQA